MDKHNTNSSKWKNIIIIILIALIVAMFKAMMIQEEERKTLVEPRTEYVANKYTHADR